jgi:hypothetical protein
MASKETPKKIYRTSVSPNCIDPASCRLCRTVGDTSHRKDIFKPSNRELLKIAEHLHSHNIAPDPSLPSQVCRPCECRLKNCLEFHKVILATQEGFKRQLGDTQVKRCIDVLPSISRPPKSTRSTKPPARTSLISAFGACEVSSSPRNIEVIAQFHMNIYIPLCQILSLY